MRWRRVLLAWVALSPFVDGELLPIKTYSTADGLASDRIDAIVADSRGFLWFCTPEGLSRFDGRRFVNYSASDGLPHSRVFALTETSSGDLWIGTARGLSRITANDRAARLTSYKLAPQGPANYIVALAESRSGTMLAATQAAFSSGLALASP